ncbi:hypothetical protein [Oceanospirillum sediminis]|uniref:Uncharacterized protein n=1 Tax=Oceanospirillum sediminis TaxID=2760088 RepID=A0A839IXJ4_9GAMM|nr:hypothetical protein [Oceanospirillum sediminis]MBB1489522.1 hypothetical protein [Oceanospirillum sediminis]
MFGNLIRTFWGLCTRAADSPGIVSGVYPGYLIGSGSAGISDALHVRKEALCQKLTLLSIILLL